MNKTYTVVFVLLLILASVIVVLNTRNVLCWQGGGFVPFSMSCGAQESAPTLPEVPESSMSSTTSTSTVAPTTSIQSEPITTPTRQINLGMKTWHWVETRYANGSTTVPRTPSKFTLTFSGTNRFSVGTDCNGVGGEYTTKGSVITFDRMISTMMYCEGSQEGEYGTMFAEATSYRFTSAGELIFTLKPSGGMFVFK